MSDLSAPAGGDNDQMPSDSTKAELRIGAVLGKALAVYLRNFATFSLLAFILFSPNAVFSVVVYLGFLDDAGPNAFTRASVFIWFLSLPLVGLLTASLTYGTYRDLLGTKASIGSALGYGLRLAIPVVLVTLIFILVVALGSLLVIIPGIFLFVIFVLAVPVAVVERTGIKDSFKRSRDLTVGYRWKVFAVFVIFVFADMVIQFALGAVSGLGLEGIDTPGASASAGPGMMLLIFVVQSIVGAFYSVLLAVLYNELRVMQDGIDAKQIAAVFE